MTIKLIKECGEEWRRRLRNPYRRRLGWIVDSCADGNDK